MNVYMIYMCIYMYVYIMYMYNTDVLYIYIIYISCEGNITNIKILKKVHQSIMNKDNDEFT